MCACQARSAHEGTAEMTLARADLSGSSEASAATSIP